MADTALDQAMSRITGLPPGGAVGPNPYAGVQFTPRQSLASYDPSVLSSLDNPAAAVDTYALRALATPSILPTTAPQPFEQVNSSGDLAGRMATATVPTVPVPVQPTLTAMPPPTTTLAGGRDLFNPAQEALRRMVA